MFGFDLNLEMFEQAIERLDDHISVARIRERPAHVSERRVFFTKCLASQLPADKPEDSANLLELLSRFVNGLLASAGLSIGQEPMGLVDALDHDSADRLIERLVLSNFKGHGLDE